MDAYEGLYVVIFDVLGEYLNAYMPDEKYVRIKLEGEFVYIMCDVNPDLIPNIRYKNGKKVIYLMILKYLYGRIELALIWYDLYVDNLKELGFVINL